MPYKAPQGGVYADLRELVKIRHQAVGFTFLPRQPIHSVLAGQHASRLRGRGLNFEEIRGYLPGDDIRTIDWKVTARMRKPHVRAYTEERDRPVIVMVDQRQCMFFGSRTRMKSVTAAEATALAVWRTLEQGDRIGAVIFNDERIVQVRPHRSVQNAMNILNGVIEFNHSLRADASMSDDPEMLNRAFEQVRRLANHDYLIVTVSDGFGADEDTVRLATMLSEHNDLIAVLVSDPLEAELPDVGRLVVAERDSQLEVDTSDSRLRKRFGDAFEQRVNWIREMSRRRQIPVLPLTTTEGVAEQVRRVLGHRPSAGGSS